MGMTQQQRIQAGRQKLAKLKEASARRGSFGNRLDWRPRARVWLHPDTQIEPRKVVWFPKLVEDKEAIQKGKKGAQKMVNLPIITPQDPARCAFMALVRALEAREDIEMDTVVLSVGNGKERMQWNKGEILGEDGFGYKKRLRPRDEVVMCAVMDKCEVNGAFKPIDVKECQILEAAASLGEAIHAAINSQMDEHGEDEGNPFITPYPLEIKFDKDEVGSKMYTASALFGSKPSPKVQELLDAAKPDMTQRVKADDPEATLIMLQDALVIDDLVLELEKSDVGGDEGEGGEDEPAADDEDLDDGEDEAASDDEDDKPGDDDGAGEDAPDEEEAEESEEELAEEEEEPAPPPPPVKKPKPAVVTKVSPPVAKAVVKAAPVAQPAPAKAVVKSAKPVTKVATKPAPAQAAPAETSEAADSDW